MAKFKFNKSAMQKVIKQAAQAKGEEIAAQLTVDLNALKPACIGQPVGEVKAKVQQAWRRRMHSDLSEPKLTEFAELLVAGGTVRVTASK
ncbi:hypothetical protein ACWEP8_36840 [Streptomyces hydrogenans]